MKTNLQCDVRRPRLTSVKREKLSGGNTGRQQNRLFLFAALSILLFNSSSNSQLDSNAAAFEGKDFTYIFYPPKGFEAVSDEAINAGYSLAYIPNGQTYETADITIDITIFRLKDRVADKAFMTELITEDLKKVKSHFGQNLFMRTVDSVKNANDFPMTTVYFNDTTKFIPTVMMSYFNGLTEIVIFELSISKTQPRFKAEQIFTDCIASFKSLQNSDIEERNKRQKTGGK